ESMTQLVTEASYPAAKPVGGRDLVAGTNRDTLYSGLAAQVVLWHQSYTAGPTDRSAVFAVNVGIHYEHPSIVWIVETGVQDFKPVGERSIPHINAVIGGRLRSPAHFHDRIVQCESRSIAHLIAVKDLQIPDRPFDC